MKLLIATLAATVALTGPVAAGRTEWNPPVAYDQPYFGELTVITSPQEHVPLLCDQLFMGSGMSFESTSTQKGCARWWDDEEGHRCTVVMINSEYKGITPSAVLRHEIGHCNGWPGDHPE